MRNSLLNISCNDLDVAIETISQDKSKTVTGVIFANALMDYQKNIGAKSHSIGVIKRNPQQSKHIEAASTRIHGIEVDFLHLRQEEYTNSRIPTISNGSIQEDAFRRDFTVNALYYNLHTEWIEDYVGGVEDLKKNTLRCPLDPYETFLDDPLRILRAVRFAAQFNLTVDAQIIAASRKTEIQRFLCEKVSRERVGKELIISLERSSALRTFYLLENLHCLENVFRYSSTIKVDNFAFETEPFSWSATERQFICVLLKQLDRMNLGPFYQSACFFASVFTYRLQNGEMIDRISLCLSNSLKLKNKLIASVLRLLKATIAFAEFLQKFLTGIDLKNIEAVRNRLLEACHPKAQPEVTACFDSAPSSARIQLFSIFRSLGDTDYVPALCNAVYLYAHYHQREAQDISPEALFTVFGQVLEEDKSNLLACHEWNPIIRGNEISQKLVIEKHMIKRVLTCVLYLQVEIPEIKREKVMSLLKQNEMIFKE